MTDLRVSVPDGWDSANDPYPGVALLLRAPDLESGFRANAVFTVDNLEPGMTLRDWQGGTDMRLPGALTNFHLLDLELLEVAGAPGVRRLAHHTAPGGQSVTMEQWAVVVGTAGYTLTASAPTLAYLSYGDVFADLAASWAIETEFT